MALLVLAHLGPANWQPRTGLGWQIEHFLGYFVVTSIVCLGWPLGAAAPTLQPSSLTPSAGIRFLQQRRVKVS